VRNDVTRREAEFQGLTTPVATLGGIPLEPRDHLCVFHRGREERDRLLLPFLVEGLHAGQACTFFAASGEGEGFAARLKAESANGRYDPALLEVHEPEGGHLRNGAFAPDALLDG
jgi:hypothetical protein